MLSPKRVKFRKMFKGRTNGLATRGSKVSFGDFGLQALEPGWVTNRQIEAARVALTRHIKRGGKVDSHLPRQADHEEAGRDTHGQGKGLTRGLGGRGEARPCDVRAGRCDARDRAEGNGACCSEAQCEDEVREA